MNVRDFVLLAVLLGWALRDPETIKYLWRKPTDWNAVRKRLGYEPAPDRPVSSLPTIEPIHFRGFWPFHRVDWDRERERLGY